jgi:hypothetical protein
MSKSLVVTAAALAVAMLFAAGNSRMILLYAAL